jgi:hypothetical protein
MYDDILANVHAGTFTKRQQLFLRYTFMVLVDLTVLNFFNEYWDLVYIETFSISLLTAVLLQILLKASIALEHYAAGFFKGMSGLRAKISRVFTTWLILFVSKLVILQAISYAFGDSVTFSGPVHGLVAFTIVIVAIIAAEQLLFFIYKSLGNSGSGDKSED